MIVRNLALAMVVVLGWVVGGCGSSDSSSTDIQETGQQIGDVMASIDEAGGSSGAISFLEQKGFRKTFARREVQSHWALISDAASGIFPNAHAALCSTVDLSACSSNVRTRTFGGCTVGGATFSGTVALTWSDAATDSTCQLAASGHTITRVPAFSVTGRRGATLTVSKTGTNGQVLTRGASAGTFTFTNDGIKRVFVDSTGATTFDFTTETTSGITVSGASRASRTLSGGGLKVTNNLAGSSCTYVPSAVTWTSSCNCPTSGSWSGTCSDGSTSTLTITGCGTADLSVGSSSESFTFDRCSST